MTISLETETGIKTTWRHGSQEVTDSFVAGKNAKVTSTAKPYTPKKILSGRVDARMRPVTVEGQHYESVALAHSITGIKKWKLIEMSHLQKLERKKLSDAALQK